MFKQFGGKITPELKERYAQSPNWKAGKFENLVETGMDFSLVMQFILHLINEFVFR